MSGPDIVADARLTPATYPMVEESDAEGLVASIYVRILRSLPMVPSLFKSLAVCPTYLALSWDQTAGVLDDDRFRAVADELVGEVAGTVPPPTGQRVRELLAPFVDPLARMLLVTAGLRLGLDGRLDGAPAQIPPTGDRDRPQPQIDVPSTGDLDGGLVGAIRRDLGTPIVNSVWRWAAVQGVLADAWQHLGPHARDPGFAATSSELRDSTLTAARGIDWPVVATPGTLGHHGAGDAAPGIVSVLDAYLTTLPRVLVLVASVRGDRHS